MSEQELKTTPSEAAVSSTHSPQLPAVDPSVPHQVETYLALWLWLTARLGKDYTINFSAADCSANVNWIDDTLHQKIARDFAGVNTTQLPDQVDTLLNTFKTGLETMQAITIVTADAAGKPVPVTGRVSMGMIMSLASGLLSATKHQVPYDPSDPNCYSYIVEMIPNN